MRDLTFFNDVESAMEEAAFCSQAEQQKYVIVAAYVVLPKKDYSNEQKILEVFNFTPEPVDDQ